MYTHAALFFRMNVSLNLKSKIAHHPCTHMLHVFFRVNVNLNLKSKIAHHPCTHMPALFEHCLCAYDIAIIIHVHALSCMYSCNELREMTMIDVDNSEDHNSYVFT